MSTKTGKFQSPRQEGRGRLVPRMHRWAGLVALLVGVLGIAAPIQPAGAASTFSISASPGVTPAFSSGTNDYVVRCTGSPTTSVTTTGSGAVTIGGHAYSGPTTVAVPLVAGQAVYVVRGTHTYGIRCLPADFPNYTATITGKPQAKGYLVTPGQINGGSSAHYVVAFDKKGVPVWWYLNPSMPMNASFFGAGSIGWWLGGNACGGGCGSGTYTIRTLNGAATTSVGDPNGTTGIDLHDFQKLSNGDFLGIQYGATPATADLSSWGLSSTASVTDCRIVELNPSGSIIWSWSANAHIDVATANTNWHGQYPDVFHMNSFEKVGNQILISFRHLDAVFDIDKKTGNILWKVGGSTTPQSLTVVGNLYPQTFSGQHDARFLSDGTVTVHDNASQEAAPFGARALRFQIDTTARTATIVEAVADPNFPGSAFCCGSVGKLSGGNWIASWGFGNFVTELTPLGVPVVNINYAPYFSYRAAPVLASDAALSQGMDAMVAPAQL